MEISPLSLGVLDVPLKNLQFLVFEFNCDGTGTMPNPQQHFFDNQPSKDADHAPGINSVVMHMFEMSFS